MQSRPAKSASSPADSDGSESVDVAVREDLERFAAVAEQIAQLVIVHLNRRKLFRNPPSSELFSSNAHSDGESGVAAAFEQRKDPLPSARRNAGIAIFTVQRERLARASLTVCVAG